MQTKLQELTEKIYQEGINKANEEADKILSDAKKEALDLIARATKETEELKIKAAKEAEELRTNSLNELQLASRQALSDLKQRIVGLIETKTIKPETKAAFKNPGFLADLIKTIVGNWNPKSGGAVNLQAILPESRQKDLEAFFKGKTAELLEKNLEVSFSDKIKGGFKIGPKAGGYLVAFSDEDFEHFFQAYMRPKLIELLFSNDKKAKH